MIFAYTLYFLTGGRAIISILVCEFDYSLQTAVMQVVSTQLVTLMKRRNHSPQMSLMAAWLLVGSWSFLWVGLAVQLRQYLTQRQLL